MDITGTVDPITKRIALTTAIAAREERDIEIESSETLDAGTYRLVLSFGGRTIAICGLTEADDSLSGTLNLATTQIDALFAILPMAKLRPICAIWNATGTELIGRSTVDLLRNEADTDDDVTPVPVSGHVYTGNEAISNGATYVDVDMSSISPSANASIVGAVILPIGATEGMTIQGITRNGSTTRFEFQSAAPSTGYVLNWLVAE